MNCMIKLKTCILPLIIFAAMQFTGCKSKSKQGVSAVPALRAVQNDSAIFEMLKTINTAALIGKPVDLALKDPFLSKCEQAFFTDEPPGNLSSLTLVYSTKVYVQIYAEDLKYVPAFNKERKWSVEDFRKEAVSDIQIIFEK